MADISQNNKRIAKNTLLLYFRMIVVTIISLLTVKYTLKILGVEDYGIYNVVGGVVSFLTIVTSTMTGATQRFLAYDLGRKDVKAYNNTFNMLLLIYGLLSVALLFLFQALAYPIVYKFLVLPTERVDEAFVVYQLSVLTFLANVMAIPYTSSIIANERMGVYAYITIIDTFSKLAILVLLVVSPYDKLITYSVGILFTVLLVDLLYVWYNQKKIELTSLYYYWDKSLFKKLVGYTGWSLFRSVSGVMCGQGLSILMNLFFGVTVNAAKAISDKIKNIVYSFVSNFYLAVSPQIIKNYAAGEKGSSMKLAFRSTKLSYYLLFVISLPVILSLDEILRLWLDETCTPDMVMFTRLSLVFALVNVFEAPITFMVRATGDVKRYQIIIGVVTLMVVPLAYVLFLLGLPAYTGFFAEIIVYAIAQFLRVLVVRRYYDFSPIFYFKEAVMHPLLLTIVVSVVTYILNLFHIDVIILASLSTVFTLLWIWCVGLQVEEKALVVEFIRKKIKR